MDRIRVNKEFLLPLIPLREMVSFPSAIIPILVGRDKSINALKQSMEKYESHIFLSVQKNQTNTQPGPEEIFTVGIIARIEKSVEQENGSFKVIIHGLERAVIKNYIANESYFLVRVTALEEIMEKDKDHFELSRNLLYLFEEYVILKKVRIKGIIAKLENVQISEITDVIIFIMSLPVYLKQSLLEELNVYNRAVKVLGFLKKELMKLRSAKENNPKDRKDETNDNNYSDYRKKNAAPNIPDFVKSRAKEELDRLEMMPPFSAESTVSRYYLDWIFSIPWQINKEENHDIKKAAQILNEDHYGLHKIKERILDYLAVHQLIKKQTGEILCFVGPPGVGKSSLSKSIARALDREFVRVSLGGIKDEAEIRGHRRTYIGSYPGQIVKGLKKAKVMNPVFLLDEIDKLSSDFRGDPASALLEVLDPEQNSEFIDHYLDLEIDLSKVFFITTANYIDPIPPALKDRMEIIEIPGYTEREKLEIAKNFLLVKQAEKNGINIKHIEIDSTLILAMINQYTREAGVRNLERQIAIVMRKIARNIVEKKNNPDQTNKFQLNKDYLNEFLGPPRFKELKILNKNEIGVAIGLAWTASGGDILIIESRFLKGKGELILTGRMGEIMKESSSAAYSYIKVKLHELEFDTNDLEKYNIHIHIPEGAVPKEGPSAGVTLAVSMISLLTGIPVRSDYAMTGEITLRGKVLPVGGIKEKIIAAHRYGIYNILLPKENQRDYLEDLPDDIKETTTFHLVENMDEVLALILEKPLKIKNINSKVIKPFLNPELQ